MRYCTGSELGSKKCEPFSLASVESVGEAKQRRTTTERTFLTAPDYNQLAIATVL